MGSTGAVALALRSVVAASRRVTALRSRLALGAPVYANGKMGVASVFGRGGPAGSKLTRARRPRALAELGFTHFLFAARFFLTGGSRARRPRLRSCDNLIGCSEMRWFPMALLAVAIVCLAGCAGSGPLSEPCGGLFVCAGLH